MIYVIVSSEFKEDSLTEHETVLKIGYTDDDNYVKRFQGYQTHNYSHKILFKIIGGTSKDERNLHHYFERYRVSYHGKRLKEWFKFDNFIIEFFKTHATIESIREDVHEYIPPKSRDSMYNLITIIRPFVLSIQDVTGILDETIYEGCSKATIEYAEIWIKTHYKNQANDILCHYEYVQSLLKSPAINKYIYYLKDPNNGSLSQRLRNLCENTEFSDEIKKIIARQVSEKLDQYYNIVGPERCSKLGYNTTYIRNEIKTLSVDHNELTSIVYDTFKVNSKYSNAEAKEMLKKIYEICGIKQTAKAINLKEFFEIKRVSIFLPDKKKINGLELLKKIEQ